MPHPPLTFETLQRKRGINAPTWYPVHDFGLGELILYSPNPPLVGVVRSEDGELVQGRFFPVAKGLYPGSAILVRRHEDDAITRATVVHELCHWRSYCEECGHVPSTKNAAIQCRYKGEHDREFYKRLEVMHRASQTPLYAARAVEGTYPYPEHWNESDWP